MAKGFVIKSVKIKPENKVTAEGIVESFGISSTNKASILFLTKITVWYKVQVRVEGLEKPLTLKVCNKLGWGVGIAKEIEAAENALKGFPLEIGDKITVEYDRIKPKKCNKID
ncbi:MAG: hypothetical protein K2O89_06360 [Clostridia bacterium]|nr:hypothetical protein [Clostridia bacterium]